MIELRALEPQKKENKARHTSAARVALLAGRVRTTSRGYAKSDRYFNQPMIGISDA
jgi:hypothetical protein